jgi:hypothetical protein
VKFTLIFVYNADSGLLNAIKDGIEKITSPLNYQCRLCGLTYGFTTMKKEWKMFIETLQIPVKFLHRDEFNEKHGNKFGLPAAFLEESDKLELLISKEEMNDTESLNELIHLVQSKLNEKGIE